MAELQGKKIIEEAMESDVASLVASTPFAYCVSVYIHVPVNLDIYPRYKEKCFLLHSKFLGFLVSTSNVEVVVFWPTLPFFQLFYRLKLSV